MLSTLSDGILLGLILSMAAGPIFFMLIQLGIERGVVAGMTFSAGVLVSDVAYVILAYLGVEWLSTLPNFNFHMGLIGGSILIAFGMTTILSKYKPPENIKTSDFVNPNFAEKITSKNTNTTTHTYVGYFLKGIAVNIFNPFVLFLWIAVTGNMVERSMDMTERTAYFLAILLTVALTDFIKLMLAWKIRTFMQPKHFQWLRYIAGSGLVIFGLVLMYRVV